MILFATKHKKYHLSYTPTNQRVINIFKSTMILWDFSFKKNYVTFCQASIYHNWFPRTDIIRQSTRVVTTISLFYNCSQFVTGLLLSILFAMFTSSFWGISIRTKKTKGNDPSRTIPFPTLCTRKKLVVLRTKFTYSKDRKSVV